MVEIIFTAQALNDINTIAEFIARDSEKYASIQTKRFFDYTDLIENNPHIGRVVPELNNKAVREIISGNYRIIYLLVNESRADILTVHHSYRLLKNSPIYKDLK